MKYYEDFLPEFQDVELLSELNGIKNWKDFNRNNSHMKEFYEEEPLLHTLRCELHSKKYIEWIEKETNLSGLMTDAYGTGEGVSLMKRGDRLEPHIDFNWNNRINMHRAVNLTVYLGSCKGGEFQVWEEDMKRITFSNEPMHNSAILFIHSETKAHGVAPVVQGRRYAIRQFYYTSNAVSDNPHQSLYWYNPEKLMPTNT